MKLNDHGDDRYRYPGVEIVADFSSNVPHLPEDEGLWRYLTSRKGVLHRYPEPRVYSLEYKIAGSFRVPEESVLVTSGATEAIYMIAHLFAGRRSYIPQPTFSEYRHSAQLYGHAIIEIGTNEVMSGKMEFAPNSVVWLCNPNNPTGLTYDHEQLLNLMRSNPSVTFVVDQSYLAFTPKRVLLPMEVVDLPNCFLIHSLTKSYAIPGLRLGYLIAAPALLEQLVALKLPWSVNAMAVETGHYLLGYGRSFHLETLLEERRWLVEQLLRLGGVEVYPTDTHYFLAKLKRLTAAEVKDWLVFYHGILIRDASNFPTLSPYHIRLATQSREQNEKLITALNDLNNMLC